MERQVLDENAPLYNRRTGAMKLEPMDYAEAALFFPDYSPEEKMAAYAMLGGMPSYLEQFDPEEGIARKSLDTILRPNTYLSQEPDWLLLEDLRRDVIYGSILRAVAQGARKPSDIARAIGKDSAQEIGPHLATLQELGLLVAGSAGHGAPTGTFAQLPLFPGRQLSGFLASFRGPAREPDRAGDGRAGLGPNHRAGFPNNFPPAFERACRDYLWRALRAGICRST